MGIGTLGFLKGATKTTLDSIEAREEAEMELKKQKDLEKFRADYRQQLEMKEATTFQTIKKPDGSYETVGFNKQGARVTSRESTLPEIKTVEDAEVDRTDTLDKRERDKRRDDQVYTYADEDQRMQRETHGLGLKATKAQIDAYNRSSRGSSLDAQGGSGFSMSDAPQLFLSKTADEVINIDSGIQNLINDYDIPSQILEAIKKDAVSQAMRDPNAKSPAARAQLASSIMRRALSEVGQNYPKTREK